MSPFAWILQNLDNGIVAAIAWGTAAMTAYMAKPIIILACLYYAVQGLKWVNGDPTPLHNFVPNLLRVGTIIWLTTNLNAVNQWIVGLFYSGIPDALINVLATPWARHRPRRMARARGWSSMSSGT